MSDFSAIFSSFIRSFNIFLYKLLSFFPVSRKCKALFKIPAVAAVLPFNAVQANAMFCKATGSISQPFQSGHPLFLL